MINMKMALVVLASATMLSLAACSDKKQETEQTTVESSASEATPVTNIEVSPDMIDAAPLESEEAGASAPAAASEAK